MLFLHTAPASFSLVEISKHSMWNNAKRNENGSTVKKRTELHNYQIIHRITYTHRQPNCSPSNIDIFLPNIPHLYECQTIDDLPSNHLPIELKIHKHKATKKSTHRLDYIQKTM